MSSDTPTVSIIMPSYNPGGYLRTALQSAVDQLGPRDEIVVQDALSTDGAADIYAEFAAHDSRIAVMSEKDGGQSDALNRALARAAGDWVVWLNADDVLLPGALAAVRSAIAAHPDADLVIGNHQIVRADGSVVDTYPGHLLDIDRMIRLGCSAFSGSIVMRTAFLRAVGGFDDRLNTVMDLDLQLRLAAASPQQVQIPQTVGALRFHEGSKTANLWQQFVRESHQIRFAYADTPGRKVSGGVATMLHLASIPIFRIRLTPGYRRMRERLAGSRAGANASDR